VQLNSEERNLLSVAYKNVVGARRASWCVRDSRAKQVLLRLNWLRHLRGCRIRFAHTSAPAAARCAALPAEHGARYLFPPARPPSRPPAHRQARAQLDRG
jgi:hypothetical protein